MTHQLAKRRTILIAAAAYSFTRGAAYIPGIRDTPVQESILYATANGAFLWVYVLLWLGAGILCLANLRCGCIILSMAAVCGLMGAWGAMWMVGWLMTPGSDWWQTAWTYWGPALMLASLTALVPRSPEA